MKTTTTSYEVIHEEYKAAFKAYKKAHSENMRNDCKRTRDTLREAVNVLNNTQFVQSRNI